MRKYAELIIALVVLCAVFGSGWLANGWRKNAEIAEIKEQRAKDSTKQSNAALDDLAKAAKTINDAATQYSSVQTTLGAKLDQLRKDLKNAKPLPVDCRPDDFRVRHLGAAIDAANKAAAGQ